MLVLPFKPKSVKHILTRRNHGCLRDRPKEVLAVLCQQLNEGSLEGFDVRGGKWPKDILSNIMMGGKKQS